MGEQQKRAGTPTTPQTGTDKASGTQRAQKETSKGKVEGEGSYTATRRYNQNLERHQNEQNVEELADDARKAIEGPEAEELRRAEEQGKRGPSKAKS